MLKIEKIFEVKIKFLNFYRPGGRFYWLLLLLFLLFGGPRRIWAIPRRTCPRSVRLPKTGYETTFQTSFTFFSYSPESNYQKIKIYPILRKVFRCENQTIWVVWKQQNIFVVQTNSGCMKFFLGQYKYFVSLVTSTKICPSEVLLGCKIFCYFCCNKIVFLSQQVLFIWRKLLLKKPKSNWGRKNILLLWLVRQKVLLGSQIFCCIHWNYIVFLFQQIAVTWRKLVLKKPKFFWERTNILLLPYQQNLFFIPTSCTIDIQKDLKSELWMVAKQKLNNY